MEHMRAIAAIPLLIVWGIWHRVLGDTWDEETYLRAKHPDLYVTTDWHDGTD